MLKAVDSDNCTLKKNSTLQKWLILKSRARIKMWISKNVVYSTTTVWLQRAYQTRNKIKITNYKYTWCLSVCVYMSQSFCLNSWDVDLIYTFCNQYQACLTWNLSTLMGKTWKLLRNLHTWLILGSITVLSMILIFALKKATDAFSALKNDIWSQKGLKKKCLQCLHSNKSSIHLYDMGYRQETSGAAETSAALGWS